MSIDRNRNVYVGHRYVPKIEGEWDKTKRYEGLTIVSYEGASYTSKKAVPQGIDILDTEFWENTGNYNIQMENYRIEVERYRQDVDGMKDHVELEIDEMKTHVERVAEDVKNDLETRSINVLSPPSPLEPLAGDGVTNDTENYNAILNHLRAAGGGTIIFPSNREYRIGGAEATPDNTTIQATGAYFKAPTGSNGITLTISGRDSMLTGGVYDGFWDGGTSIGRWEGAVGTIPSVGNAGNQPALRVNRTDNAIIENVIAINSVNDGINGSYNNNLTLVNCVTRNTAEHGFYFSYSDGVYAYNCKSFNIGLNNWDKGSVMFKSRNARNFNLFNYEGYNIDPQSKGGFNEGSCDGFNVDGLLLRGVHSGIYLTLSPDHFSGINNISVKNFDIEGTNEHLLTSIVNLGRGELINGRVTGFSDVFTMNYADNVYIDNVDNVKVGHDSSICESYNIHISNVRESINIYGQKGSTYELDIVGTDVGLNRNNIYGDGIIFKKLSFRNLASPTGTGFYLKDGDLTVEESYFENVNYPFRNNPNNEQGGEVTIFHMKGKNLSSFIRDDQGVNKVWNIITANNVGDMTYLFYNGEGSVVNYGEIRCIGSKTGLSIEEATLNKFEME